MLIARLRLKSVWLLGFLVCVSGWAAELPVNVPVCETPPVLDGKLDDVAWKKALSLGAFTVKGGAGTTDATECLVLRDDTWLYFGFRCRNKTMRTMTPIATRENQMVARDDSVEVFFDPGTGGKEYFQFMLSFANVQAQRRFADGKRDVFWSMPWRSATGCDEAGWTGELAMPLFLIASYGDPGRVRINVCRNERLIELDPYGAFLKDERIGSTWRPISKSYNEPEVFGAVGGFKGVLFKEPFLVDLEKMEVGAYELDGEKTGYTVDVGVRSYTGIGGAVLVEVSDSPAEGEKTTLKTELPIKPMCVEKGKIFVPVKTFVPREVSVVLKDAVGAELRRLTVSNPDILNLMGETVVERNYYTTEAEARLRCRLGLPVEKMREYCFAVKLGDGTELARVKAPTGELELTVPLKDVPEGEQALRLILEDQTGKTIVEGKTILSKLTPRPGCEVKINRFKGILEKNGVPIFPFGLDKTDVSVPALKEVAQADHTVIQNWTHHWNHEGVGSLTQLLEVAQTLNLDVVDNTYKPLKSFFPKGVDPFLDLPKDASHQQELLKVLDQALQSGLPELKKRIEQIKDYPALIAYYNVDEPNLNNREANMIGARAFYKVARETDPYRPVLTLFAREIPEGGMDVSDFVGYDVYNYPGWAGDQLYGRPSYMSDQVLKLKRQADKACKPFVMVIMAEALDVLRCPRMLLPGEQRCQAYLAVIHGAKGIFYFVDCHLRAQSTWDTMADLAREMKALTPALTSGEEHPAVKYTPVALDVERSIYPDVQATLFKNPGGGYVLLAANAAYHPVDVKFIVPGIKASAGVKRLFVERKLAADEAGFVDQLEPLGTRAYAIEFVDEVVKPVALALEQQAYPEQALVLKWFNPAVDFKGKRNCAANPSFEEMAIEGIPDYVRGGIELVLTPRMGAPNAAFALDSEHFVHGKVSWRETIPLPAAMGRRGFSGVAYIPAIDKPTPIVFSAYVKASANLKLCYMRLGGLKSEESYHDKGRWKDGSNFKFFTPTTEWQRITFKGMLDPSRLQWPFRKGDRLGVEYSIGPGSMGFVDVKAESGKVEFWVDAVQIELGEEATEFTTE